MAIPLPGLWAQTGKSMSDALARPFQNELELLSKQKLLEMQMNMQQKQAEQERNRLQKFYSKIYPAESAAVLANLPPKIAEALMRNPAALSQGLSLLSQSQGIPAQEYMQQFQEQPELTSEKINELLAQQEPSSLSKILGVPSGISEEMPLEQQVLQKYLQKLATEQQATNIPKSKNQVSPLTSQLTPQELIAEAMKSPAERREEEKLALKKQQIADAKEAAAFKETKAERKDILEKARAARQNLEDLGEMEQLQESGKLDTPGYIEFLKRSGLDIPSLMNPESQEFQKIAYNFMRDAKSIFGSRISNMEIENFLKTIPSLSQSNEGRKRVIANLKKIARGNLAYSKAMKQVIAENKGIPPLDFMEQIDDKIDKELMAISKQFRKDLGKPVPQEQNRLTTALQSTLGTIVGRIPRAALGAGAGAATGAKFLGVPGAIGGGLLGGLAGLSGISIKDII